MNLACPECSTIYRIDPARVEGASVGARCRVCETVFRVDPTADPKPGHITTAPAMAPRATPETPEAESEPEPAPSVAAAPAFGPQDPETRARRLARALVSDIKVYNPDKWEESRATGTLRREFRDEILKSWEEYVEQVGEPMAKKTPYFRDALNDILAGGERMF